LKVLDRLFEYVQMIFKVNRLRNIDWKIIDGWSWFSITDNFCKYVLEHCEVINEIFKHSIASDELVFQTLAYNSEFYNTLYDTSDLKRGSMRYIDWSRGKPYVWGKNWSDFDELINSPFMFARKFDEEHLNIVNQIYEYIRRREENDK